MIALLTLLALSAPARAADAAQTDAAQTDAEQIDAETYHRFALASGYERLWNAPFVQRSGSTLSLVTSLNPWLGLELRGGFYPLVGERDWKPLMSQLADPLQITPDLSRVWGRAGLAVALTPLRVPLNFRGGEYESALGVRLGLGGVWTEDDLELSGAVGDPAWESTASQVHPAVTYGVIGELDLGRAGVRIRLERTDYVEIVGGDTEQRQQTAWFGIENVWYFGGGAD